MANEDIYIALSGGFDPLHEGHVAMIHDARALGKVIILLNSDAWLHRKKGFVFMSFESRKKIMDSVRNVELVLPAYDADNTVCQSILNLKDVIKFFGQGGDRWPTTANPEEIALCEKLDIPIIYGLGGGKVQSSSALLKPHRGVET